MTIPSTFEHDLERGSGRAVLAVMAGYPVEFRDVLTAAIATNHPLDGQIDNNRSAYLHMLIGATKEPEYYVGAVCELLRTTDVNAPLYSFAPSAYAELAYRFAVDGFGECRAALRDAYVRWGKDGECVGEEEIVKLDEVEGLVFVAEHWPDHVRDKPNWAPEGSAASVFDEFRKSLGRQNARIALRTARLNPAVETLFDLAVRDARHTGKCRQRKHIAQRKKAPNYEEICAAADGLLAESDPKAISIRLMGFTHRPFPLNISKLLDWAVSDNRMIRHRARVALSLVRDDRTRELAYSLFHTDPEPGTLVHLLNEPFRDEDEVFIEKVLAREMDPWDSHGRNYHVWKFIEKRWPPRSVEYLTMIFETEYCGECRGNVYELLAAKDAVPDWMRREAAYDASDWLRELAENDR